MFCLVASSSCPSLWGPSFALCPCLLVFFAFGHLGEFFVFLFFFYFFLLVVVLWFGFVMNDCQRDLCLGLSR